MFQPDIGTTMTKQQLQKYKPSLARSSLDCRLAGKNETRLRLSKASSSTLELDRKTITFLSREMSCLVYCFLAFLVFVYFLLLGFLCLIRKAVTRGYCIRIGARNVISTCVNEG